MSKPSQFLRHPWSHRSDFQKTKGYGKINLDECTVIGAKSIALDSDDELSDSQRAVKRRRIEKLADGYLRGEPLLISSARPCPQTLNATITRHKKSHSEPGFLLPEVTVPKASPHPWTDVEDDDQILDRLLRRPRLRAEKTGESSNVRSEPLGAEPVEDVSVQASCRPQRRLRTMYIGPNPSEAALQQAAALRDRKRQFTSANTAVVTEEAAAGVISMSDPADSISVTRSERAMRSQHGNSEWLSRRKSRFSFESGNVHAGDTTLSPCVAPTSPPPISPPVSTADTPRKSLRQEGYSDTVQQTRSLSKASHRTVTEHSQTFEEPVEAPPFAVVATNRHSPQPSKETRTSPKRLATTTGTKSATATRSRAMPGTAQPTYLQAPSTQNGTTPLMYRKRTTRARPGVGNPEIAPAPATRRSTRRRVTFPSSEDVPASGAQDFHQQNIASHPPVLDMSFQPDYSFAPKLNMALIEEHSNKLLHAEAPSDVQTVSVKKALPRELRNSGAEISRCGSEPPPSSHLEDDAQLVNQRSATAGSLGDSSVQNKSKMSDSERRQTWVGTQAMVARAERDLFTSPEKYHGTFTPINERTPASIRSRPAEYTPLSQEREPLKQLSQEPAPSTQALLDGFGGFSTVKKPRTTSMLKQTAEPTPVAMEKGKRPESLATSEVKRSSTSDKLKGDARSSLRFSISSFESPVGSEHDPESLEAQDALGAPTTTKLATPAASSSSTTRSARNSALKHSNPRSAQVSQLPQHKSSQTESRFSHSTTMSEDFPTSRFFHRAQAPEDTAPAGLLRDPSNLSQTIEDLTNDVLGASMRELEGVLSQ